MTQKPPRRRSVSPSDLVLMDRLATDLVSGGVDLFLANEREWAQAPLASFMQGKEPEPEPPALDAVAIFAKWNSKPSPSTPVMASAERPKAITDLDATAIYAKWNGIGSRQQANAGA